jgi:hypothetical protein
MAIILVKCPCVATVAQISIWLQIHACANIIHVKRCVCIEKDKIHSIPKKGNKEKDNDLNISSQILSFLG